VMLSEVIGGGGGRPIWKLPRDTSTIGGDSRERFIESILPAIGEKKKGREDLFQEKKKWAGPVL